MLRSIERFLGFCIRRAIAREQTTVRVIVGSIGKTSTKEAVGIALGAHLPWSDIRVSPKNFNNELGVPLTILDLPMPGRSVTAWIRLFFRASLLALGIRTIGVQTLILELGADHPGDLATLLRSIPPTLVIVTAITEEHMEFFGTMDAVEQEELTPVRMLKKGHIAILNADDPRVMHARGQTQASIVTFGKSPEADVRILTAQTVIEQHGNQIYPKLEVEILAFGSRAHFHLNNIFGTSQAYAIAAALAVISALDADFSEAVERLRQYTGVPGRTRIIEGIRQTILLDDSYNSSPAAAAATITDFIQFPHVGKARKIAVIGDMLELGALAHDAHITLGTQIASAGIDFLVTCGTLGSVVARSALHAGMSAEKIRSFPESSGAAIWLREQIASGDIVLIKGSRGTHMELIVQKLMAYPETAHAELVSA